MNVDALIRLIRETTGCDSIAMPVAPVSTGKRPMGRWRKKRLNKKVKRTIWESVSPDRFINACKKALARYADPSFSSDQCCYVTGVIVRAARQIGLSADVYSTTVLGFNGHNFAVVNGVALDFTLNQFSDDKPWPFIAEVGSPEFKSTYADAEADHSWYVDEYDSTPEYAAIMGELSVNLADSLLSERRQFGDPTYRLLPAGADPFDQYETDKMWLTPAGRWVLVFDQHETAAAAYEADHQKDTEGWVRVVQESPNIVYYDGSPNRRQKRELKDWTLMHKLSLRDDYGN